MNDTVKTAVLHHWLVSQRGGEKVLESILELYPQAPIYTLVCDRKSLTDSLSQKEMITSFLQRIPGAHKIYQSLLPLMPHAVEQFDFSSYDLVISSDTCVMKGAILPSSTCHICYCHTPARYAWNMYHSYKTGASWIRRLIMTFFMTHFRLWDFNAAQRVNFFIANSKTVQQRIYAYYRRNSVVIYPPVDTEDFEISDQIGDYYLCLSQLIPYKKIDIAIHAFNKLKRKLIVVGTGSQMAYLKKISSSYIEFFGYQTKEEIKKLYAECKAFIFPGEEDFGITPLEANASGRPVIAFAKGGALETIVPPIETDGQYDCSQATGLFFKQQTPESLIDAIHRYEAIEDRLNPNIARTNAKKFSKERFQSEFKTLANQYINNFKTGATIAV